ncbi:SIS domain-containing protein [Candidatus Woesearchaeota archaeon]|nr:SIS domain-containing protein [Candidatus Woesearchaeota archaeon]MCF8013126.1 SIS domain-containing protein [Candidatus Woesearchaeota archaeon]
MTFEEYSSQIKSELDKLVYDEEILFTLKNTLKTGKKIFIAGNGGSASIANHCACDFSKGATSDWKNNFNRYKVISLSSNLSYMTAISNDENYTDVFKQQLVNLAEEGDILILISSSGNSPNIINALEYAKEIGMVSIGICGFDGGQLKKSADLIAHVNMNSYEVCEDVHSIFCHYITIWLRNN